jgi:lipoyl(octanoyl) transferase
MHVRHFRLVDYRLTHEAMQAFTQVRSSATNDELWLCQHPAVFTQGLAGKTEHLINPGTIAVVQTQRGGQVTYHGPGQVVAYPLLHLQRRGYFVKEFVYRLEESVIRTLAHFGVTGHRIASAPGIYVRLDDPFAHGGLVGPAPAQDIFQGLGKISALGIKVSRHCSYHGLSLNVAMDLSPFARINPCGYAGLQTVDLHTIGVHVAATEVERVLAEQLLQRL